MAGWFATTQRKQPLPANSQPTSAYSCGSSLTNAGQSSLLQSLLLSLPLPLLPSLLLVRSRWEDRCCVSADVDRSTPPLSTMPRRSACRFGVLAGAFVFVRGC